MDAGDLKVFEAVARLGGMNRAAAELNTVQSNVTARIRALEADIGSVLLERHSRGVSLTAAGRRLLPYARQGRPAADRRQACHARRRQPRGPLTIGSLGDHRGAAPVAAADPLRGRQPEVDLVLRTGTTCELVRDVLEQRVEGAFVCGPVAHADLDEQAMFREELVVLAAPGVASLDAVFRTGEVRLVVLRAGCSYRQMLEVMLVRRGIVVQRQLEFGTLEAIFGCVCAGLGITLLPRALVGRVCEAGRVSHAPAAARGCDGRDRVHSPPRRLHLERDAGVPGVCRRRHLQYRQAGGSIMARIDESRPFIPVNIAVLTVSDTRTLANDTSGDALAERIAKAGHRVAARAIEKDDAGRDRDDICAAGSPIRRSMW